MNNNDYLNVWYDEKLVGKIFRNSLGLIGFIYDKAWLSDGFAISQQLPLQTAEYSATDGIAHRFFANLLPEANARMHIVRDLKISDSDFELLAAIGGECAGALSILPEKLEPNHSFHYRKLNDEELKIFLLRRGQISSINFGDNRPRLSLAGAQDKCPILVRENEYFIPEGSAPSSHILKFELAEYRNIPIYEYFLTELAKIIGLSVVDIQLCENNKRHYLLIKRYDRIMESAEKIQRLHQEDFCQALGFGYERKYQQEGGPSFLDCYRLVQEASISPIEDAENLLRWQIFNVLAGNSDGHAKNLSFIYNEHHQAKLAPFYDLVCTRAIERIDTKLALSIGGEFNPDKIISKDWAKFAEECNIRQDYLNKLIQKIAETLLDAVSKNNPIFESIFSAYPALQRVKIFITKQCKKILKQLESEVH